MARIDSVKFWCPIEISKSEDPVSGITSMKLGGIASTADEDTDGEFLDPQGFDIKPLMKTGVVNWHHQAKGQPKAIIGEPVKAEIRPEGLYIETELYQSSQIAKDVFELAETLEKDSKTRRLGYSIEGKVIKRKSNDKKSPDYKIIQKAIITGVAITHQPKNHKTFANIIKGETGEDEDEEEYISKEVNSENSSAVIKESVDKKLKDINALTKAEVMDKLFTDIPSLDLEKGEKIYILLTKISAMAKRAHITDEDIEKAYEVLNLDLEKADNSTEDSQEDDSEKTEEVTKSEETDGGETTKESEKEEVDGDEDDGGEKVSKSQEVDDLDVTERLGNIEKAISGTSEVSKSLIKAVGVLVKDVSNTLKKSEETTEKLLGLIEEQSEIIKAQGENISSLNEQLEVFGSQSQPRKSLTSKSVIDRNFDKGDEAELQKAEQDKRTLSISKNKAQIVEILDKATFEKGYDPEFGKACTMLEASGHVTDNVIARIQNQFGIKIVK